MASVSSRARSVKQPRGGYIKPSQLKMVHNEDGMTLNEEENVHGGIIGMVVDYLTRFSLGSPAEEAFYISMTGASIAQNYYKVDNAEVVAKELLDEIKGIDERSIINACKLVTFDVWLRNPRDAKLAKGYNDINPDPSTIHNIQVFVQRCVSVFREYGPIIKSEVTFEPESEGESYWDWDPAIIRFFGIGTYGGYTGTVNSGDGDYLTEDTLWDVKVLRSKLTNKHTLQLLMYWIMGQHSGQKIFKNITRLGIFNPRLNNIYLIDVCDIPEAVIQAVEDDVICYRGEYLVKKTASGIQFDMKASNGDILASSEVYASKATCKNGIKNVKANALVAEVEDQTVCGFEKCRNPKFEVYTDAEGDYYFRLKAKNGGTIATGNRYKTKDACLNIIERIRKNADSPIVEDKSIQ